MAAKEKWMGGDIPGAQAILQKAFEANEDSESIFLAAAKLASETGEMDAAQQIMEKARAQADTDRVSPFNALLRLTLLDLDEVCCSSTSTRPPRFGLGNARPGHSKVSHV